MREFGVFARHWTPGEVKSRLAVAIGPDRAAEVYRASLEVTLERFTAAGDRRTVVYTPPKRREAFAPWGQRGWLLRAQGEGDLGERMRQYFDAAFATGAQRVILIGSDSPTLPESHVAQAWDALLTAPVVLGPADDGGYYLVGLSRPLPGLFASIPWGTSAVWPRTQQRLAELGVNGAALPGWRDFDDLADLQRLRVELAQLAPHAPVYQALARAIEQALPHCH
jgi:uncharacterized protein